ncbi:MAG: DUF998 domain-containing protein [Candidatus Methanomethylophilaceae archaeon]|jgi:hypothetical membrane protein|nr:DUF998 domain-containing protein [Candidatus Methanomethylophilaceae archaeon]NLF34290.1 DUF998 domain-containing protein [Thermoplasmatales archaeon]
MIETNKHNASFALLGIVGVVLFVAAWIIAASTDTSWVFGKDSLYELGVSSTDARFYFNYACMICGVLMAAFGLGHALARKNPGVMTSGLLLAIAGVFLLLTGIFVKEPGNDSLHMFCVVMLGFLVLAALVAMAFGDWKDGKVLPAGFSVICIIAAATFVATTPSASWSAAAFLIGCLWIIVQSAKMALD